MGTTKSDQVAGTETIKVGPDRVTVTGEKVVIDARHVMPDWQVREYLRIPIYFREKKYFLQAQSAGKKPDAARYELEPWPEDNREIPRTTLDYNEETVAQRESGIRGGHFENFVYASLLLFFPLLGMLWSGTKDRLARFGFVPRTITGASIMLTFGLILMDGVIAKMMLLGSLRSGNVVVGGMVRAFASSDYLSLGLFEIRIVWLDIALFVALVLDLLIRYSQYLRDDGTHWGFLEWITCLVPKKKVVASAI